MFRKICVLAAAVLGASLMSAGIATAAGPPVTGCSGTACVTMAGSSSAPTVAKNGTVTLTYAITVPSALDTASFSTSRDPRLDIENSSVEVDGGSQSATLTNGDFTLNLGALASGSHTVSFNVFASQLPTAADPDYVSDAALTFIAGGQASATSTARVTVALDAGSYAISALIGPGKLPVQPNSWVSFPALVSISGTVDGALTLDLPSGLGTGVKVFRVQDGSLQAQLTCSASGPAQARCIIPANPSGGVNIGVFIPSAASVVPGTTGSVGIKIAPVLGVNRETSEDHDGVPIAFFGRSTLQYTITPAGGTDIPVGGSADFDGTVRNIGPSSTPQLTSVAFIDPPTDGADARFSDEVSGAGICGGGTPWHAGPLAAGQSASLHVRVTANTLGATGTLNSIGTTYSPSPDCFDDGCEPFLSVNLRAIAGPHITQVTDTAGNVFNGKPELSPGDTIHVTVANFEPNAAVDVSLHSSPRDLGVVHADATGKPAYTFIVPDDLASGEHSLVFTAGSTSISLAFTAGETLAATGATPAPPLALGSIFVLVGVCLVAVGRRPSAVGDQLHARDHRAAVTQNKVDDLGRGTKSSSPRRGPDGGVVAG
jgi:hypothetical protein